MEIKNKVLELVDKLSFEIKDGKELDLALKHKLTKKELKLLKALAFNENLDELKDKLKIDDNRLKDIKERLIKKLNNETFKQEIYEKPLKEL